VELILEVAPLTAHRHVDPWPQTPIVELAVGGKPLLPVGRVVPYQIVDLPRKLLLGCERRVGVGS
jgi:hypothetical protein